MRSAYINLTGPDGWTRIHGLVTDEQWRLLERLQQLTAERDPYTPTVQVSNTPTEDWDEWRYLSLTTMDWAGDHMRSQP